MRGPASGRWLFLSTEGTGYDRHARGPAGRSRSRRRENFLPPHLGGRRGPRTGAEFARTRTGDREFRQRLRRHCAGSRVVTSPRLPPRTRRSPQSTYVLAREGRLTSPMPVSFDERWVTARSDVGVVRRGYAGMPLRSPSSPRSGTRRHRDRPRQERVSARPRAPLLPRRRPPPSADSVQKGDDRATTDYADLQAVTRL